MTLNQPILKANTSYSQHINLKSFQETIFGLIVRKWKMLDIC